MCCRRCTDADQLGKGRQPVQPGQGLQCESGHKPASIMLCTSALSEKSLRKTGVDTIAVHPGVPISVRHHRGHATAGERRHFVLESTMTCVQVLQVCLINEIVCTLAAD